VGSWGITSRDGRRGTGNKQGRVDVHGVGHLLETPQYRQHVGTLQGIDHQHLAQQGDQGWGAGGGHADVPVQDLQLGLRLESQLAKHEEVQQATQGLHRHPSAECGDVLRQSTFHSLDLFHDFRVQKHLAVREKNHVGISRAVVKAMGSRRARQGRGKEGGEMRSRYGDV
jgi:hypothetical protein